MDRWEAHTGEDYTVVMRDGETTDNASIRVYGEDAKDIAFMIAQGLTPVFGIHAKVLEKVGLARTYAEDGAFLSASRIHLEAANILKDHAIACDPTGRLTKAAASGTRITKRREEGGWRVLLNGKPSPLFLSFDKTFREWDLGTEEDHIMSAASIGAILRRLDVLAVIFVGV
jgi:hypothetical protein